MKAGDKVVCVDDSPCHCGCGTAVNVKKGLIYVIREVFEGGNKIGRFLCLDLYGVVHTNTNHASIGIWVERFRLLEELKQEAAQRQSTHQRQKEGVK